MHQRRTFRSLRLSDLRAAGDQAYRRAPGLSATWALVRQALGYFPDDRVISNWSAEWAGEIP
jgi:hypothetical protein